MISSSHVPQSSTLSICLYVFPWSLSKTLATAHPFASTLDPLGVSGHWSLSSVTPSPSESLWEIEHPSSSASSLLGVFGHLSLSSETPSLSESSCEVAQPSVLTVVPAGVSGHLSSASATPSLSASISSKTAVKLELALISNVNGFAVPLPVPVHCLKI